MFWRTWFSFFCGEQRYEDLLLKNVRTILKDLHSPLSSFKAMKRLKAQKSQINWRKRIRNSRLENAKRRKSHDDRCLLILHFQLHMDLTSPSSFLIPPPFLCRLRGEIWAVIHLLIFRLYFFPSSWKRLRNRSGSYPLSTFGESSRWSLTLYMNCVMLVNELCTSSAC